MAIGSLGPLVGSDRVDGWKATAVIASACFKWQKGAGRSGATRRRHRRIHPVMRVPAGGVQCGRRLLIGATVALMVAALDHPRNGLRRARWHEARGIRSTAW